MNNRYKFNASTVGTGEKPLMVALGVKRYLVLELSEDEGLYVEVGSPTHSGFNIIDNCTLSKTMICVTLSEPLNGFIEIEGSLSLDPTEMIVLKQNLSRIFAGADDCLTIEEQD